MIDGISGVAGRINEIHARIGEIQAIGRDNSMMPVNRTEKSGTEEADAKNPVTGQKFSDVLKQVMEETGTLPGLPEGVGSKFQAVTGTKGDANVILAQIYKKMASESNPGDITRAIGDASTRYGVESDLIKAVIEQESGYEVKATSHKGAMGLMQLMPKTAEMLGVDNPYDPRENIMGGTRYLRAMLDKFDGDLEKSVAAYNAGPNAVDRYKGIPPYAETQDYVKQVLANYNRNKAAE